MKIIGEFIIKDILDYEIKNDISIMDEIQNMNFFILIDLIKIGNKCSDDEAEGILYKALEQMSYEEIIEQIAYELIGRRPEENEECIEAKDIKSFSDNLEEFYSQLQTVDKNLSISEFQNMSTRYLYRYAEGVQKRFVNSKNQELQGQFTNVAMFMSALGGKLKECPQLNEDGTLHKQTLKDKIKALHNMG